MSLQESEGILTKLLSQMPNIESFVLYLKNARDKKDRVWLAGNGGSAYTVAHFASDLMNLGFDVFCMVDNIARLTAITNDYGWEFAYEKQLKNFRKFGVLILVSVHGGGKLGDSWSQNLLLAAIEVKKKQGRVLSFLGCDGGRLKDLSDVSIIVPSELSCYVEGFHSLLAHIVCEKLKEEEK